MATPTAMTLAHSTANLLKELINAAEKASNIARVCRSDQELLTLLVQEKIGDEANARFEHDFKTLADVLIQETIKRDLGQLFPSLRENIRGEECPTFTNTAGTSISVAIGTTVDETTACLESIMNGNHNAAQILASEVHRHVNYSSHDLGHVPELPADLDFARLGVWIDPIDGTAEYIAGDSVLTEFPSITASGLDCVTVLIGVYDRDTGEPIIGVVSQPFHTKTDDNSYRSTIMWGVSLPECKANNCCDVEIARGSPLGIFSKSENENLLNHVLDMGYKFVFSAGAGHKALKVITGDADFYLLSQGSTFRWDTCAPQAILRSMGGNIYDYQASMKNKQTIPLNYVESTDESKNRNHGGLIAARNPALVQSFIHNLAENI